MLIKLSWITMAAFFASYDVQPVPSPARNEGTNETINQ